MSTTVLSSQLQPVTTLVSDDGQITVLSGGLESATVLSGGIGPVGPVGPQGPGGSLTYVRKSSGAISALRVVRTTDADHIAYADAGTIAHVQPLLGITTTAASVAEENVTVVGSGSLTDGSWSWTPDAPIFCGLNGVLTQTFSGSWAWSRVVAWAQSATSIVVQIREPVSL